MRCASLRRSERLSDNGAIGAIAPGRPKSYGPKVKGKHFDCALFVHILKKWGISGTPPKPDPICENTESEWAFTGKEEEIAEEFRFATLDMDFLGRIVVVVSTYRGDDIRSISARPATPRERKHYEQGRI